MATPTAFNDWPGKSVPVFVYGTLRQGGRLHDYYIPGAQDSTVCHATVEGYDLIAPPGWGFPLLVPSQTGGRVHGDFLWMRQGSVLESMVRMEMGAGYDVSLVTVEADAYAFPIEAVAFTWQRDLPLGSRRIASGDWLADQSNLNLWVGV